ncbi:hybrid sensor histidine kinase/response regulator [Aliikangiella coralliicola]|uniref:histidine kinase n=1 Tax=Aliikangiella coralliicola TaxID=2592383 RepID=A0A545TW66_9GAMM|nr:hybrid sensor histidine kinase/response regulator [Aliikangiella coralliicola]TQV81442.1 response regulator [Aliikangiella coralliicola]
MQIEHRLLVIIPILVLLVAPAVSAQQKLRFHPAFSISSAVGASNVQDEEGFLWFGSVNSGLIRYDGTNVKQFLPEDGTVASEFVSEIYVDRRGQLWIATGNGLNRYDKQTNQFYHYIRDNEDPENSLANNQFLFYASTGILEDNRGYIWIGTSHGLSRYDPESDSFKSFWHNPDDENSLSGNTVSSLYLDNQNRLWIALREHGVTLLDLETYQFTRIQHNPEDPNSIPADDITSIVADKQQNLWLGTRANGLIKYNSTTKQYRRYNHKTTQGFPEMGIAKSYLTKSGALVLITYGKALGFIRFNPDTEQVENYRHKTGQRFSLASDTVSGYFEDSDGFGWIAFATGEVYRVEEEPFNFELYQHDPDDPNSLGTRAAFPIFEDSNGNTWIGTYGNGLDRLRVSENRFYHYKHIPGDPTTIPHDYPTGFIETSDGKFYVATFSGMSEFDPTTGKVVETFATNTSYYTILEDPDNADILWASGWDMGFHRFNRFTRQLKIYSADPNDPNSLTAPTAVNFIIDRTNSDVMWIATLGGGLEQFNKRNEVFTHYMVDENNPDSIRSNTVPDVLQDKENRIWVATEKGLSMLNKDQKSFTHFGRSHGFPTQSLLFIMEDNQGKLWIGSAAGLILFNPVSQKVERVFTETAGLHSTKFFPSSYGKGRDGRLWVSGYEGLNSFYPDKLKFNVKPPIVYLTELKSQGKNLSTETALERLKILELDWKHNQFEFEYVALNFINSVENRYQYKLEGYDDNWFDAGKIRHGRYVNLPGGKYKLRIRGANSDNVWSSPENQVFINISVQAAPWKSGWAYFIYIVSAFAFFWGTLKWRELKVYREKIRLQNLVEEKTLQLNREKEAAEAASLAKSTFLANMSHELRTPLNAILGFTELSQRAPKLPANVADYLNTVQHSGNHLLELINDVLDMAKVEAGKTSLAVVKFDLHHLLGIIEEMFSLRASAKGLKLIFEIDVPRYVQADERKLRQVLINLVSNAVKFTREGKIVLRATFYKNTEPRIHFEVEDTGVGIAESDKKALFEPFTQAEVGREEREGTGLGLAISAEFVCLMGGEIRVYSEVGKGTIFSFDIDVEETETGEIINAISNRRVVGLAEGQPSYRILIADDNPDNRKLLSSLLGDIGFEVKEANNGAEAVERWREWKPALIWMDMHMPVLNGYDATRMIKQTAQGRETVVIALTASAFEEERSVVLSAGCDDFIRKPFESGELFKTMASHLALEFRYEEIQAPMLETHKSLCPADLTCLSVEQLKALHAAALSGDVNGLERLSVEIKAQNQPLAESLNVLINQFEFEPILAATSPLIENIKT